ncbi:MAG: hypothetical protein GY734_06260 [Herbaspirillum sp.]|uniref:M10 family metallopeptidase C-terminal domain-containing protein n=1 Tax=Herbaspirillum sp. TaxID=1890675 RepID=UPI00258F32CB|nr:hypothetical protein [Herbaspirillum sp.]MCP3656002.1 hypothetical protein [Herbaspirillum sp.]MCP3948189.1 hypothetical protein [Herbaspirillum sp.]MCP4030830.1 hypothetical protein [Herbaspirillum sp.]MCP4557667.1 hypothetical protein [Herbaspirillum sp.]
MDFNTSTPVNQVLSLSGVRDVAISYNRASGFSGAAPLVLSKSTGTSFTAAEVKALLEGILFKTTSTAAGTRQIDITLTHQTGITGPASQVRIDLDRTPAPALSMSPTNPTQVTYDVLSMKDIFGDPEGGRNPKVLGNDDRDFFNVPYTDGSSATNFLSRIKGISATWGGIGIASGANNLLDSTQSYLGFNIPPVNDVAFAFSHQGGPYIKAIALKFSKTADDKLVLSNNGSTHFKYKDMYTGDIALTGNGGDLYGIGNINLLYERITPQTNRTPTFEITFDGSKATVGAIMSLYDGARLLANQALSAENISQGKVRLTVPESLGAGLHQLQTRYTEESGDTSSSNTINVTLEAPLAQPFLSDLKVKQPNGTSASPITKNLGSSTSSYASYVDPGLPGNAEDNGVASYDAGPTFAGTVGRLNTDGTRTYAGKYLISVSMGGKLLGFTAVDLSAGGTPGAFEIKTGASLLAPGFYKDLSFTVTEITPDSASKGQTTSVQNLAMGYYWVAQRLENAKGGAGDDELLLGSTSDATGSTTIETGSGRDVITVGKFSNVTSNLSATISDFERGVDKVKVFLRNADKSLGYQNITAENWRQFAPQAEQSAFGSGTKLVIDLDGAGTGTDKYTLYLPTVAFNYETNTKSLFGL